jgi:hypothetical protein
MEHPLLKCGHAANATTEDGRPCCAICIGISEGAQEVAEKQPDLKGRRAKCTYCMKTIESSLSLAFFEHRPHDDHDDFYCGCRGWD